MFRHLREVSVPDEYSEEYLRDTVKWLAEKNAQSDQPGTDLVIPRRLIRYLMDTTEGNMSFREVCILYLDTYLEHNKI